MSKPNKVGADNVKGDLILSHLNKIHVAQQASEHAAMSLATVWKNAKTEGVDTDALKWTRKLLSMDPQDALHRIRSVLRQFEVKAPGVLSQGDLFSGIEAASPELLTKSDLLEVESAGYRSSQGGAMGQHDHGLEAGSERAASWERGWLRGQADMAASLNKIGTPEKVVPIRGSALLPMPGGILGKGVNTGPVLEKPAKPAKAAKPAKETKPARSELKAKGPAKPRAPKKASAAQIGADETEPKPSDFAM